MWHCRHRNCTGHDEILEAVLHTLEYLVTTVDQLAADFATYQTDVQTEFDALKAEIAAAIPGGIPDAVQAKIDALDAAIVSADVAVKAGTAPAPTATEAAPSDTPTPTDTPQN